MGRWSEGMNGTDGLQEPLDNRRLPRFVGNGSFSRLSWSVPAEKKDVFLGFSWSVCPVGPLALWALLGGGCSLSPPPPPLIPWRQHEKGTVPTTQPLHVPTMGDSELSCELPRMVNQLTTCHFNI